MVADGPGFAPGATDHGPAQPINLAPSILAFLGLGDAGQPMDGTPLQNRLTQEPAA